MPRDTALLSPSEHKTDARLGRHRGQWVIITGHGNARKRHVIGTSDRAEAESFFTEWKRLNQRPEPYQGLTAPARLWLTKRWKTAVRQVSRRGLQCTLTMDDMLAMYERSQGRCELTGIPFDLSPHVAHERNPYRLSLDRIDSSKGYTPENCRLVCVAVNYAMGPWGERVLYEIASALIDRSAAKIVTQLWRLGRIR